MPRKRWEWSKRVAELLPFTMRGARAAYIVIFSIAAAVQIALMRIDAFDRIHDFTRAHETIELDEWFTLFSVLGVACFLCLLVRARELKVEIARRRKAEASLEAVLEHMAEAVCMFDGDKRLAVCNRAYARMYGLREDQVRPGTSLEDILRARVANGFFLGADPEEYIREQLELVEGTQPWTKISELSDGRVVSFNYRPTDTGGWVATHEDITSLRKTEKALIEAQAKAERAARDAANAHTRLLEAFQVVPEGLVLFDAEDRYVAWNKRYAEMFADCSDVIGVGVRLEDALRTLLKRAPFPEAVGREEEWLAERLKNHRQAQHNQDQQLADGRWIRVVERRTADGGSIGVRIDITELKQQAEVLRRQNEMFDAALNNMSQGLCMINGEQKLLVCNTRFAKMYDLPAELTRPGTPVRDILEYRIARGTYAGADPHTYLSERMTAVRENTSSGSIQELHDGRVISVTRQPMAGGGAVVIHEDITERRRSEARILHMAHHDALTDLPNRMQLRKRLELSLAALRPDEQVAVLWLDLDEFKAVNDTLGHSAGDILLKAVATRLRGCVRERDMVARLGGDEFAIVQATSDVDNTEALAGRIIEVLGAPFDIANQHVSIGTSIGIAMAPGDSVDPDELLRYADAALYRAKDDGRGTWRFFEAEMNARMRRRRELEADLRKALAHGELCLVYQPLMDLASNSICGCEALLRWNHPERGTISPTEFIPIAEATGLIVPIGDWVLRQACADAATWPENITIAVNLSPVQFRGGNLIETVCAALAASGVAPRRLELEITESVLLQDTKATLSTLHQLRSLGVRFSMDDFGTGYSSLSYLQSFPFDKIKLDRSFVLGLPERASSAAILRAMAGLGASLGMKTTAEGVETAAQLAKIQMEGLNEIQGYLISAPRPAADIAKLLRSCAGRSASAA